jgi:hypothetical protein
VLCNETKNSLIKIRIVKFVVDHDRTMPRVER